MYEEEKRNRDNSRNRDKAQPPGGRPNYYQVPKRNSIFGTIDLNLTLVFPHCCRFYFFISICRRLIMEET